MTRLKTVLTSLLAVGMMYCAPLQSGKYCPIPIEEEIRFDKNDNYITNETIDDIINPTVRIVTSVDVGTVGGAEEPLGVEMQISGGSGIVLKDDDDGGMYVLSCDHVLPTFLGLEREEIIVRADGHRLDIVKYDAENDIVLYKFRDGYDGEHFDGRLAPDHEIGDYVIGSGYPGVGNEQNKKFIYDGRISSVFDEDFIFVDMHVNSGESGGPVFVFNKGDPYLVGLAELKYIGKDGICGIVSHEDIAPFLEDTVLEDEYVRGE